MRPLPLALTLLVLGSCAPEPCLDGYGRDAEGSCVLLASDPADDTAPALDDTAETGDSSPADDTAPDETGETGPPAATFSEIAGGQRYACGVTSDGDLDCWGRDAYGETDPPDGQFVGVSAGYWQACAIAASGAAVCWGADHGDPPEWTFSALTAGAYHTCGIRSDDGGSLDCWSAGIYDYGQTHPLGGYGFLAIAAGSRHNCALTADSEASCWGADERRQATAPEGTYSALCAGSYFNCAIQSGGDGDGGLTCWGDDLDGQISGAPGGAFTDVACGAGHACALDADGGLSCWGNDGYGQVSGAPDGAFEAISAGAAHSCALDVSGEVVCWGVGLD